MGKTGKEENVISMSVQLLSSYGFLEGELKVHYAENGRLYSLKNLEELLSIMTEKDSFWEYTLRHDFYLKLEAN